MTIRGQVGNVFQSTYKSFEYALSGQDGLTPAAAAHGVMCQIKQTFFVAIAIALVAFPAMADDWVAPSITIAVSSDGNRIVRIVPGDSVGDTIGFSGATKGPFARATYYERDTDSDTYRPYLKIALKNPVAPVDVLLNDDGVLVTLDNWHNMGYGLIVVIFNERGKIVKYFALEDLYSKEQIKEIGHSVSSRWWRCAIAEPRINSEALWISDDIGGEFKFNLEDGSFVYSQERVYCPDD